MAHGAPLGGQRCNTWGIASGDALWWAIAAIESEIKDARKAGHAPFPPKVAARVILQLALNGEEALARREKKDAPGGGRRRRPTVDPSQ